MRVLCRGLVELVTAYLDEALPPAEAAGIDRHLAACPDCWEYVVQMQATSKWLARLDKTERH